MSSRYDKVSDPYFHILQQHEEMNKKYAPLLGTRVKTPDGTIWAYIGCNDIGHPYFSKVVGNRLEKKQFTLSLVNKKWLDTMLRAIK